MVNHDVLRKVLRILEDPGESLHALVIRRKTRLATMAENLSTEDATQESIIPSILGTNKNRNEVRSKRTILVPSLPNLEGEPLARGLILDREKGATTKNESPHIVSKNGVHVHGFVLRIQTI